MFTCFRMFTCIMLVSFLRLPVWIHPGQHKPFGLFWEVILGSISLSIRIVDLLADSVAGAPLVGPGVLW